jgi:hypothetical protein
MQSHEIVDQNFKVVWATADLKTTGEQRFPLSPPPKLEPPNWPYLFLTTSRGFGDINQLKGTRDTDWQQELFLQQPQRKFSEACTWTGELGGPFRPKFAQLHVRMAVPTKAEVRDGAPSSIPHPFPLKLSSKAGTVVKTTAADAKAVSLAIRLSVNGKQLGLGPKVTKVLIHEIEAANARFVDLKTSWPIQGFLPKGSEIKVEIASTDEVPWMIVGSDWYSYLSYSVDVIPEERREEIILWFLK